MGHQDRVVPTPALVVLGLLVAGIGAIDAAVWLLNLKWSWGQFLYDLGIAGLIATAITAVVGLWTSRLEAARKEAEEASKRAFEDRFTKLNQHLDEAAKIADEALAEVKETLLEGSLARIEARLEGIEGRLEALQKS